MNRVVVILMAVFLTQACIFEHEPEDLDSKYSILNESNYDVEISIFKAYFMHSEKKDTTLIIKKGNVLHYSFVNFRSLYPFGMNSDSAFLTFNNEKRLIYKREIESERNILDINSWQGGMEHETLYKYTYTITSEDYEMAEEIK